MDLSVLAREEKDSKELCKRQENFYKEASEQIRRMRDEAEHLSGSARDTFDEYILSDERAIKNIKDLRIKKLIKMAVSDAYRNKPVHAVDNMLSPECQLYESVVSGIRLLRQI